MATYKIWTWSVDGEGFFWHFSTYSNCGDSVESVPEVSPVTKFWLFASTGDAITYSLWNDKGSSVDDRKQNRDRKARRKY